MWIDARDISRIPGVGQKRERYEIVDVILCVLPEEAGGICDSGVVLGGIHLDEEGNPAFVASDDPCWGSRVSHWMPLLEPPEVVAGLSYDQWKQTELPRLPGE